eukprot:6210947-Pleurochrysis_carterae.AAC.2
MEISIVNEKFASNTCVFELYGLLPCYSQVTYRHQKSILPDSSPESRHQLQSLTKACCLFACVLTFMPCTPQRTPGFPNAEFDRRMMH